jgi:beta-lactamase regulating signal transducer with metallopeptidase domain
VIAAVLNHLWQSTLFAGMAGLLALALHRNGAHVRFWLWFAASVKFLVPFAALAALSAYVLPPVVAPVPAPTVKLIAPLAKPFSAPAMAVMLVKPRPAAELSAPLPQPVAVSRQPVPPVSHGRPFDWEMVLLALWAAGFSTLASRWLLQWSRLRTLLQQAVAVKADAPIAIKFSRSRLEPGLVGIIEPVILLPEGIERQLSPAELAAVLAHELCHWRRHDNLLAAIHMLVEALFWFFPLVWWLGARLNTERERACDESVLADGNDPQIYAEGILKVCRAYLQSPLACAAGVSGAGLKRRIETIVENRLTRPLNAARKLLLSAFATAALALPLALGLLTTPVTQIQAKAAQILSPVARHLAPNSFSSSSQAATDPAPLVPQAAAAETTTPGRNDGDALTRQNTVQAEPSSPPLPDLPALSPTQPAAPSDPAPTLLAANDQPAPPNPAPVANTASCAAPKLLNSLPMVPTPGGDTMTVLTSFDGKPQRLLIGISDTPTQLWNTPAVKLGLPIRMGRRMMDGAGRISEEVSRLQDFALGNMKSGNFDIQIGQDPDFADAGSDGILGTDMMMRYDIDLDFAHRRMNYFEPEQCSGAGLYWSPATTTAVPMKTYANVVYVPVTLDGHTLVAVLDTSASRTFLNPRIASQLFGLKADDLEPANVTEGGSLIKAGRHRFSGLTLGGMRFSDPELAVPFDILSQSYNDSHISRTARNTFHLSEILPDIVIGMDMLKQTHLYLSFQSGQVYVSPAGDGQALKQTAPTETSWFNVWRYGYDPYYNFRHPSIKF